MRTSCLLAALLLCACDSSAPQTIVVPQVVPDFALLDVNANSATVDTNVSPRDHIGGVSAWYFGSAT